MRDELLAAAAEALGAPSEIVIRSAEARASADGVSVEEILSAWAGGAAVAPAAPPPVEARPETRAEPEQPPEEKAAPAPPVAPPAPSAPVPAAPPVATVVTVPRPVPISEMPAPILEGQREQHGRMLAGAVALFLAGMLGAVILPAFAVDTARTAVLQSELAEAGRTVYVQEGCGYCHTQLVRPIVTDAQLGPVTEAGDLGSDLPTTAGVMRIGPDLAHVGSRPISDDAAGLAAFLRGEADRSHQSYRYLSQGDLNALVAYLQSLE